MDELRLISGGHDHETRQAGEKRGVESARVGRPVGADEAGAINVEADRQALDRNIVHDLVVRALKESRDRSLRTA